MDTEAPGLDYVMTAHLAMVPGSLAKISDTPTGGERWSINVAGGVVEGPRLNGRVLSGGIENPVFRRDGVLVINARWLIETDDGETIYVENRGIRRADTDPEKMRAWLTRSKPVQASDFYFRVQPTFETSSGKYDWLTRNLFVGTLVDPPEDGAEHTGPSMRYFMVR